MIEGAVRKQRGNHFWMYYNAVGQRWCPREKHWAEPGQFHLASQWCKACRSAYAKERYDPKKARKRNFQYYYGHQEDLYWHFFELQHGLCAICHQPPSKRKIGRAKTEIAYLSLDHDHATGRPRGLLCQSCNFILGWMRDHPTTLDRVRDYLEEKGEFPKIS